KKREENNERIRNLNNEQIDYSVLDCMEEAGFKDSFKLLNKAFTASMPTLKNGKGKIRNSRIGTPRRIDFVWCNATAAKYITKSTILKNGSTDIISDHYPMYVELQIP